MHIKQRSCTALAGNPIEIEEPRLLIPVDNLLVLEASPTDHDSIEMQQVHSINPLLWPWYIATNDYRRSLPPIHVRDAVRWWAARIKWVEEERAIFRPDPTADTNAGKLEMHT